MPSTELIPYDQLAATLHEKTSTLGPYQQADCTAEFNDLSTQLYGGNIFGENSVVTCSASSTAPLISFSDRAITQRVHHGNAPLQVATLDHEGLHIANENVFLDWLANRSIDDEGAFVFSGVRQAVRQSPLAWVEKEVSANDWASLIPYMAHERISSRSGISVPGFSLAIPENVAKIKTSIAHIASKIDHQSAADIAEVVGTEHQLVPHVIRTPGAALALKDVLQDTTQRTVECLTTGIWIATVHLGFVGIRGDLFMAGENHRDKLVEDFERQTQTSGPRIVKAIGHSLDQNEYHVINSLGQFTNEAAKHTYGNTYATPYQIQHGSFPPGTLLDGTVQGINYRIYLPTEDIV